MKKHLFIPVFFAVLMQTFGTGIIYLNFQLNRSYIAQNLCVKKEVKNNCCQGSCHLKKQLGEEEKKEKSPAAPNLKTETNLQLFCQHNNNLHLPQAPCTGNIISWYRFSKITATVSSVFHPPGC